MMKKKPMFQEGQALQNEDSAILKLLVSLTAVHISNQMLYVLIRRQNNQLSCDMNLLQQILAFIVDVFCSFNSMATCTIT